MNQKELRALIRARVLTGQLPRLVGGRTFGGRGSRNACDCCSQIIGDHEVEYQVELIWPALGAARKSLTVHPQCLWIWREECDLHRDPSASQSLVWDALRESIKPNGPSVH
jgi:hypothetical protein